MDKLKNIILKLHKHYMSGMYKELADMSLESETILNSMEDGKDLKDKIYKIKKLSYNMSLLQDKISENENEIYFLKK